MDIFFQGGDSLAGAEWLKNGKTVGSIQVPSLVDNVYWYGYTPPTLNLPNVTKRAGTRPPAAQPAAPAVDLLGRYPNLQDASTTSVAPAEATGIDFAFYLPLDQKYDDYRGCFKVGSTYWAAPPLAYAYTTHGMLNSRVSALTCPRSDTGLPLHFNHLDFSWRPSPDGTENALYSVRANFNNSSKVLWIPDRLIPQPPPGSDGIDFGFHHDNYQSTYWTQDGTPMAHVTPPGHTRMALWHG